MQNIPQNAASQHLTEEHDDFDLMVFWNTIWQGRWLIIGTTTIFSLLGVAYAFTATQWYRAEVLLAPATNKSVDGLAGQLGGLGGLASLVGISVGAGGTSEPLAILKSRDFTRAFIEELNLLPVFFARKWDAKAARWTPSNPKDWPDIRDGVKYFSEEVRGVQEDKKTGMITLTIEWKDAQVAAEWATLMVERVNDSMRARALAEAQTNVGYLQRELASASVVTLQQSIGRLLDGELQKLMMARGKKEFAFRVIDRPETPKWRSWPKRPQTVALCAAVGAVLSVFMVFLRDAARRRRSEAETAVR